NPALFRRQAKSLGKLRHRLSILLQEKQPDVVVSTYPVYGHIINQLFDGNGASAQNSISKRSFALLTVVTDSISVCSAWFTAPSDLFIVPNEPTANVLLAAGIPEEKVKALGFPVSPLFVEARSSPLPAPGRGQPFKILFVINTGKAKAGHT